MIELSFETKSPLLPGFSIKLHNSYLDEQIVRELTDVVVTEEHNILTKYPAREDEVDPTWLTSRLWHYNFLDFDYPCVKQLHKFIADQYIQFANQVGLDTTNKVYIQCWANLIKNNGRIIAAHNHSDAHCKAPSEYCYLSGNIPLQTENTKTYYKHPLFDNINYSIPNTNGEMILFPSFVVHWTDPNLSEKPRITLAFDIITEEVYNMVDAKNFRQL